ncbi:hypothetical protein BGZ60DRAFT_525842 [Tricladium varicosporioides]|nr:hypothetical protein BGZ60DRAFT_525842 [Hymenoscyphus varicosporioides]
MDVQPFPLRRLPYEIRREIYLLATQPRFVEIKEHTEQEFDDFVEDFKSRPLQIQGLHPSLAFFAHNWRGHIPTTITASPFNPYNHDGHYGRYHRYFDPGEARWREQQTTLDMYGFTTTKQVVQPWVPSDETPEIPLSWLISHPEVAWELTRESYLYSSTQIPPLLHTCVESRQVLKDYGYELAFRTRTSGPRTWFCFRDDVLFLGNSGSEIFPLSWLLSPGVDVGQYDQQDLVRVRRLALKFGGANSPDTRETSSLFQSIPFLTELFLVEMVLDDAADELDGLYGEYDEPLSWVEVDAADYLEYNRNPEVFNSNWKEWRIYCCMREYEVLDVRHFPEDHEGEKSAFFRKYCKGYEDRQAISKQKHDPSGEWSIPSMKMVHLGTKTQMRKLFMIRDQYWRGYERRERQEIENGISLTNIIYWPKPGLSWGAVGYEDDMEAWKEIEYSHWYY